MPLRNDICTINGTITARIKNYYKSNGMIILHDVKPYTASNGVPSVNIVSGMTMTTQDSGETIVLTDSNFIVDFPPSPIPGFDNYEEWEFDVPSSSAIFCDDGLIAIDRHFTGKEQTQEYQVDNLIVEDYSKQTNDGWEG